MLDHTGTCFWLVTHGPKRKGPIRRTNLYDCFAQGKYVACAYPLYGYCGRRENQRDNNDRLLPPQEHPVTLSLAQLESAARYQQSSAQTLTCSPSAVRQAGR